MKKTPELSQVARDKGRNITRQREAILCALRRAHTHPTALELFDAVRPEVPSITLATVYRNLKVLEELGLVAEVKGPGGAARYDGNPEKHWHVTCTRCGRVGDISGPERPLTLAAAQEVTDFCLTGYHLSFEGVCPECRRSETAPESEGRD